MLVIGTLFGISEEDLKKSSGEKPMSTQANQAANRAAGSVAEPEVAKTNAKPPYPFRTGWALFLLSINFLVAAYYFHIIE
jgi:photosystem I protein